jgi:hypothetical protein
VLVVQLIALSSSAEKVTFEYCSRWSQGATCLPLQRSIRALLAPHQRWAKRDTVDADEALTRGRPMTCCGALPGRGGPNQRRGRERPGTFRTCGESGLPGGWPGPTAVGVHGLAVQTVRCVACSLICVSRRVQAPVENLAFSGLIRNNPYNILTITVRKLKYILPHMRNHFSMILSIINNQTEGNQC